MQDAHTGKDRRRFLAALTAYVAWVAGLGTLAILSGKKPAPRPSGTEGR
jgi:hypothetical protein